MIANIRNDLLQPLNNIQPIQDISIYNSVNYRFPIQLFYIHFKYNIPYLLNHSLSITKKLKYIIKLIENLNTILSKSTNLHLLLTYSSDLLLCLGQTAETLLTLQHVFRKTY